jgi:NTE family protein
MQRPCIVRALHLTQTVPPGGDLAVMLTGGGARAAYQVGLIKGIAKHFPHLKIRIVTGVSAGAINAVFLAGRRGDLPTKARELGDLWCELQCSSIWRMDWRHLVPFRSAMSSIFWRKKWTRPSSIVDTEPLAQLLCEVFSCRRGAPIQGIIDNIASGDLGAVALITLDYSTGQTVRWFQGADREGWEGPNRRTAETKLTVDHVLASSALPFLFPAVKIGHAWHGDGGIRLVSPLSPAVHLGASKIIVMSTAYQRSAEEETHPVVHGYPPAAQVMGQLLNAIFLDSIDEDVTRLERLNRMLHKLEPQDREGFRPIDLLVLRPSIDPGKLAAEFERHLPLNLKLVTRALGAKETESPDIVSMLMFEPHYTKRLMEIGEADVDARIDEIRAFLGEPMPAAAVG